MKLDSIDHIHINVKDRRRSEKWYSDVLQLTRVKSMEFWASDGGPLTLQNESGSIHLALFESELVQATTIAFKVDAKDFGLWKSFLVNNGIDISVADHQISWSIYFQDLDGNPFEITTYDYREVEKFSA